MAAPPTLAEPPSEVSALSAAWTAARSVGRSPVKRIGAVVLLLNVRVKVVMPAVGAVSVTVWTSALPEPPSA